MLNETFFCDFQTPCTAANMCQYARVCHPVKAYSTALKKWVKFLLPSDGLRKPSYRFGSIYGLLETSVKNGNSETANHIDFSFYNWTEKSIIIYILACSNNYYAKSCRSQYYIECTVFPNCLIFQCILLEVMKKSRWLHWQLILHWFCISYNSIKFSEKIFAFAPL